MTGLHGMREGLERVLYLPHSAELSPGPERFVPRRVRTWIETFSLRERSLSVLHWVVSIVVRRSLRIH